MKTKEIIFQTCSNRENAVQLPQLQQGIKRVDKMTWASSSITGWQQPIDQLRP